MAASVGEQGLTTEDAEQWVRELRDAIAHAATEVVFADPRVETPLARAEGLRYLTRCLSIAALNMVENHDPAYPHISPLISPWLQWGWPNPDYTYHTAPLHGDYQYRLFGRLGTARFFLVEVYAGTYDKVDGLDVFDSRADVDLEVGANGDIEIGIGKQPVEGIANWVKIPEGPAYVIYRNAFYDWENETPAELEIERVGATYPPPPPTTAVCERLDGLISFLRNAVVAVAKGTSRFYDVPRDTVQFPPFPLGDRDHDHQVGLRGQLYGQGHYRCGSQEAVILEVEEPICRYWMFGLVSQYMEALDWYDRQTSINGHQAVIDDDGVFRAVIAHRDPGVPNWLDTGGREVNLIAARYTWPQDVERVPTPRLRTIPFAEVRDHLPAGTPTISVQERSQYLRRRMLSVRRRNAGF